MASFPPAPAIPVLRDVTVVALLVAVVAAMATHAHVTQAQAQPSTAPTGPIASCAAVAVDRARVACYAQALGRQLRESGDLPGTLASINDLARRDPLLASRCHMLLHEQGREWKRPLDPGAIRHDGKDCAAGFLHGWMLTNLGAGGRLERSTVDAWCEASETPLEHADCEHGMGHVLVRNLRGDLRVALARCRTLGDSARLRNCASGAFMENRAGGRGRDAAAPTDHWRRGRPWHACARAASADLLDVCAAWAVRDVAKSKRMSWCATVVPAPVDTRACRVAVGASAPADHSAKRVCGTDAACWYGRGFAWAMLGWHEAGADEPSAERCARGRVLALQRACAMGVGFRRAASLRAGSTLATQRACDGIAIQLRSACAHGASRRDQAIAYA